MDWAEVYREIVRFLPRLEILNPDEVGVHIRCGKLKVCVGPGVYFCLPYFDEMFKFTSVPQIVYLPHQSVISSDGATLAVTCSVSFTIVDAEQAFLLVGDLDDQVRGYVGDRIAHYVNRRLRKDINVESLTEYVLGGYCKGTLGIRLGHLRVFDLTPHKVIRLMSSGG